MNRTEIASRLPHPLLRPYVKRYFWGRNANPPLAQRIVPNGEMGLLIFRGCTVTLDGNRVLNACIKGQTMHYHDIVSKGEIEIIGAHFTLLGIKHLIDIPLQELFETTLELSNMDSMGWKVLENQMIDTPSYQDCWTLLDDYFLHQLSISKVNQYNMRRLFHALSHCNGHSRVDDLAAEACLSTRQFRRLFTDSTGLSPKDYLRIKRYHSTLKDLIGYHSHRSLTEIAWRNGYYDLHHISKDFKAFTGYGPRKLLTVSKNAHDVVGWRI